PERDRAHRHHPVDRHRDEERDHDDRLRARRPAHRGEARVRGDLPGVPAPLPADPDDHDGRAAGRGAARPRSGGGRRAAPAARSGDRGRPDHEPAAHALHDAGHLPRLRSARGARGPPRPARDGHPAGGRARAAVTPVNLSGPFIRRPVGTTLLTVALVLAGIIGFRLLPVAPLPQVDFPTISVSAGLPGASPETMASAVATPLERQFTRIAAVTEMTSTSFLGSTSVALQFDLSRDINGAARDVQSAINAAAGQLPSNLPSNPTYRKVNPADAPIMILALTSPTATTGQMYDMASTILQQKLAQLDGVGQVFVGGSSLPAVRVELNPHALARYDIGLEDVRATLANANVNRPKGQIHGPERAWEIRTS